LFNLQPGQGLGFLANKKIAFGLGVPFLGVGVKEIIRLYSRLCQVLSLASDISLEEQD